MRYLNKVIFLNSAHVPYAEIKVDGNVHFIGTQGVGKSTLLRAILFFYNADKLRLGIPKEKKNFDAFYLPHSNSYIVYEVMRENGAYSIMVGKSMGRAAFRFIDAPYVKEWFVNQYNEVSADWNEIRGRILENRCYISPLITGYEMFRDIIFGNNRKPDMVPYRKFAIVESSKYQNIPRTIQNVFLNSKLDADFIKDTIIHSMSEEEVSVNLAYYRSQIEAFEQEYDDVMLWLKPDKNGVVVVRKQAEQVISCYRGLLYARKQVEKGREALNFAEKAARQKLPQLEEKIGLAEEKLKRAERLIGEEDLKYNAERDKWTRREGEVGADLKRIKEKRAYYEAERIQDVIVRVEKEENHRRELERLRSVYAQLTATYQDVIQHYKRLEEQLENGFKAFENEIGKQILLLREESSKRKDVLRVNCQEQEQRIRERFEEKIEACNDCINQIREALSLIRVEKKEVQLTVHFDKEIKECADGLAEIENEERQVALDVERLRLECDKLRQKGMEEVKASEAQYVPGINAAQQKREALDKEIEMLHSLVEKRKGSLGEWLDAHRPGWQENIGKVVDEERILYSQELNPQVSGEGRDTLFGVKLELSGIACEARTPEQIKEELKEKQELRDGCVRELARLNQEKREVAEKIEKGYRKQIREWSDKVHLAEIQIQQLPLKKKNAQADLATWQRKEEEWKKKRVEQLDLKSGAKELERLQKEEEQKALRKELDKRLKQAYAELRRAEKEEDAAVRDKVHAREKEIVEKRSETEAKKSELRVLQTRELDGKGADTSVIDRYERNMQAIEGELNYIASKRSLVSDYEKDKREYFDREAQLVSDRKEIAAHLESLGEKYALRKSKLSEQRNEAEKEWSGGKLAKDAVRKDLEALKCFREDEYFCPPDSYTAEERSTPKSCGELVEELKSQILSIQKNTDHFKKAVNLFNSNFTPKNTFCFSVNLVGEADYYDFASNLCEFVENNKIAEFQNRISERYTTIIHRISKEVGDLTNDESNIRKTINDINDDFVKRNFAGVIRSIELRPQASDDKLMQLLLEIKQFNEENQFNMGTLDLFSQDSRKEVNRNAVRYLYAFSRRLKDEPARIALTLTDTFNLQFRIRENDNDTGWVEKISNVGSDGTDILVKAMVNIMLINVFKEKASRKFGDFKLHCMMDEIGKLHPTNVKGILAFANSRNILLVNSSPTTYNVEDYKYTYLLTKDAKSRTRIVPLLTRKG